MERKIRALVCGSTFGQYYIKALLDLPDEFQLAGLYANGSQRSRELAARLEIPLYTRLEELPAGIDLACVVIRSNGAGGAGTDIALQLLERGVHVIQEQPVHHRFMEACWRAARKHSVCYRTGDFYPYMVEVSRFIACAKELNKQSKPLYIRASFCTQVSYPAMEILTEALDSPRRWEVEAVHRGVGPFDVATGKLGGIPFTMEYHNEICPDDPDGFMHLLHSFTFFYDRGRLSLEDTFGPLSWKPRICVPHDKYDPAKQPPVQMDRLSSRTLGNYQAKSIREIVLCQWQEAIGRELLEMKRMLLTGGKLPMRAQKELLWARQWEQLHGHFGYARLVRPGACPEDPAEQLQNLVKEQEGE